MNLKLLHLEKIRYRTFKAMCEETEEYRPAPHLDLQQLNVAPRQGGCGLRGGDVVSQRGQGIELRIFTLSGK